jgi:hypothetical protein
MTKRIGENAEARVPLDEGVEVEKKRSRGRIRQHAPGAALPRVSHDELEAARRAFGRRPAAVGDAAGRSRASLALCLRLLTGRALKEGAGDLGQQVP